MGGSSKSQVVGFRYYMAMHFAVCYGPIDRLIKFVAGDRTAWQGTATESSAISVDKPDLFGGESREGGIQGTAQLMFGEQTQTLPGFVAGLLPSPSPAFRGIFSLMYDGLISANNPYVKPMAFQVQRITAGWNGAGCWYPEKATISVGSQETNFLENFSGGLSGYTVISGDPVPLISFVSDTYGTALRFVASDGATPLTAETVRKSVDVGVVTRIKFKTKVAVNDIDDAAVIQFRNAGGAAKFSVLVSREAFFDGARRADVTVDGSNFYMGESSGASRLQVGQWYEFDIQQDGTSWSLTLTRLSSGTVVDTQTGSGTIGQISSFEFVMDGDADAQETRFSDVEIYSQGSIFSMNPAHIIYQCLTDPQWGMGYPTQTIDATSFTAAADTLFDEGLGLCMIWNQQEELGTFIRTVLDHCGGILYTDPSTGKFALKLLRADYTVDSLPVFDESNIVALDSFQRVGYGDTVNEITVVYRDVLTNKDVPITVQNLANIQAQGAVVNQTRQYPGLPISSLAARTAQRDLIASSTPLAKARMTVNREAWQLFPGQVFKLTWAKLGLSTVIMRVLGVDYGTLREGTISVDIAEDVFGLPASSYAEQEPSGWVSPDTSPQPVVDQAITEAPYRSLVSILSDTELAAVDADAAYFSALAAKPASLSTGFDIYSRVGSADYETISRGSFVARAELAAGINQAATAITLQDASDLEIVEVGTLAIIGTGQLAEWVIVEAIDTDALTATISRGILDTTPQSHDAGTPIWFDDATSAYDATERATGEAVDFKLLTISTGGTLALADATATSATAAQRQARPYPPGNVRVNGEAYPSAPISTDLTITWSHRDRLQQTAYFVEQDEASIGPEAGTEYNGYLFDDDTDELLVYMPGMIGTSWVPGYTLGGNLRLELESVRDGLASWQRQIRRFSDLSNVLLTEAGEDLLTESGEEILIDGVYVPPEPPPPLIYKRSFFWYTPGTNTSVHADDVSDYVNNSPGHSQVTVSTKHAPADKWLASIGDEPSFSGDTSFYRFYVDGTGNTRQAVSPSFGSGQLPVAVEYDAGTNDFILMSENSAGDVVKEHRLSLAGSITSTADATVGGGTPFTLRPRAMVKFSGQWRAFTFGTGVSFYFKRNASTTDWTAYPGWLGTIESVDFAGYSNGVIGAETLSSGTVLIALVYFQSAASSPQPTYAVVMRSTDGETWSKVSSSIFLNAVNGMTPTAGDVNFTQAVGDFDGKQLIRIGSGLAFYFTTTATGGTGPGTYVLKIAADGASWTLSKCTIDGVATTAANFLYQLCGVSDGSAIVGTYNANMAKTTNGVDFTTLSDSAIFVTGYADQPGDYVANSTAGDVRTAVLSSGTRILFERKLQSS